MTGSQYPCTCLSPLPGMPVIPIRTIRAYAELTREAMDALFGRRSELTILRELPEPGRFVSNQEVILEGTQSRDTRIRIIGPVVAMTEIVLSHGVAVETGIDAPVRLPGDQDESGGGRLRGPAGKYDLDDGIIILRSHLRLPAALSALSGLRRGCHAGVWIDSERPLVDPQLPVVTTTARTPELLLDAGLAAISGVRAGDVATLIQPLASPAAATDSPPGVVQVITEDDVVRAHHRGRTLRADARTLVTPAAQEADRRYHVIRSTVAD